MDPRLLYLQHLEIIDRIAQSLCRRHGFAGDDADDFVSDVRLKLLEDDYAIIRRHRGDSSLATFLSVVITNMFRDYRVRAWGKWRPSAEAKRLGEPALALEAAVYRDGLSFDDACRRVEQTSSATVQPSRLREIFARLPYRPRRRMESDEALEDLPAPEHGNGSVFETERQQEREILEDALRRALLGLNGEDQVIIRMLYYEGLSVADVARGLRLAQKPLYGRVKRLLGMLSVSLAREGIGREWLESLNPPSS